MIAACKDSGPHSQLREIRVDETNFAFNTGELLGWLSDDQRGLFLVPRRFSLFNRLWWE